MTEPTPVPDRDDHHKRIDAVRYEVDPDAVARAILERLVAGRAIRPPRAGSGR